MKCILIKYILLQILPVTNLTTKTWENYIAYLRKEENVSITQRNALFYTFPGLYFF